MTMTITFDASDRATYGRLIDLLEPMLPYLDEEIEDVVGHGCDYANYDIAVEDALQLTARAGIALPAAVVDAVEEYAAAHAGRFIGRYTPWITRHRELAANAA